MNKTPDWFCAALAELNTVYQEKSADRSNPYSRGVADGLDIAESIFTVHANNAPTEQSAWISVKDKLPEKDGNYITYQVRHLWGNHYEKEVTQARYHVETGFGIAQGVTHWQPLPEPPKESE